MCLTFMHAPRYIIQAFIQITISNLYIHGNHNIRFKIYTLMVIRVSIKKLYIHRSRNLYILRSCGAQFKIYSFVVFVFYTFVATPRYDLKLIHSW
ncbi:unnamed protein product [Rotaria socialis]|uniref:Uncharacterized protein n=3 Tax=Rotaria TaxID=231623 RepID=A0A817QIN9_9BILA|nr:unnamed protein product [Rotaria socialis]